METRNALKSLTAGILSTIVGILPLAGCKTFNMNSQRSLDNLCHDKQIACLMSGFNAEDRAKYEAGMNKIPKRVTEFAKSQGYDVLPETIKRFIALKILSAYEEGCSRYSGTFQGSLDMGMESGILIGEDQWAFKDPNILRMLDLNGDKKITPKEYTTVFDKMYKEYEDQDFSGELRNAAKSFYATDEARELSPQLREAVGFLAK